MLSKKVKIILGTTITLGLAASILWFNFKPTSAQNNAPKTIGNLKMTSSLAPQIYWGNQIGTPFEDLCTTIDVDGKGTSSLAGYTFGDIVGKNIGCSDILAASYDNSGKLLWKFQKGSTDFDKAKSVARDADGNTYITGETAGTISTDKSTGDIFLAKLDNAGKLLWLKQYGGSESGIGNAIKIDKEGNLYIAGYTSGKLGAKAIGQEDAFISKLDKDGQVLWTSQWGSEGSDEVKSIDIDKSGNLYAVGETNGDFADKNIGGLDIFMTQLTPEGKVLLTKQYGTSTNDNASKILIDVDGNAYISGSTYGDFAGAQIGAGDSIFFKISNKGDILWKKQFGTPLWDGAHSIVFSKSNPSDVIAAGCQNYDDCQAFLRKFDTNGNALWVKELDPAFSTCGREIGIDDQGYIYQTGGTHGTLFSKTFTGPTSDNFIIKISEN